MSPLGRLVAILLAVLGLSSAGSATRSQASVGSIRIHSAAGVSVTVTKPAEVATIVRWFDQLPRFAARPCPVLIRVPPTVRLVFVGPGHTRATAVDRLPGTCSGEVERGRGKTLAENGRIARISKLLGVSFDPGRRTALNKAAAQRDVMRLIEHVRVPPGSRLVAQRASRRYADAHRTWKVHMYFEDVFAFVQQHPQPGSSVDGSGEGSRWGVVNERDLFLTFPAIPHRISSREIDFHFYELHGGWTRVTADAGDSWVVARSPNEKVPAGVTAIVVHGPRKLSRRFTRPERVARIVRWFDSLPVGARDPGNWCTLLVTPPGPPVLVVDFLGSDGTKLATGSGTEIPYACDGNMYISIRGHDEAPLITGSFLRRIERLPH
jgi:hypothetical protein